MPNIFDEEVGLLQAGSIVGFDSIRNIIKVKLSNISSLRGQNSLPLDIPAPFSLFYNNGLFIGTKPNIGTPVVVAQGSGGQYYFVSFLAENLPVIPTLNDNELLIRSNDNTKITLNTSNNIVIGSDINKINILTDSNLITTNFNNENHFTLGSRNINGVIKRDIRPNPNYDQTDKLENDNYDNKLYIIGMDPTVTANNNIYGSGKNPAFTENRELIYEFQPNSNVSDDLFESQIYNNSKPSLPLYTFPNRRASRSDTLSLSLVSPNFLIENIKGTVVDIFGNILDLNRYPLPIGQDQNTLRSTSTNKLNSFQFIKALERKSLAYHFEINARKDLTASNGQEVLPDVNSNADYARNRSRFFLDIDKEGQFKLNVPASSETGNIPLLTRYENYSTFGPDDNNNPNKLIFRDDNLDIFQDSFAAPTFNQTSGTFNSDKGSIVINNNGVQSSPSDRITGSIIKHGTAFHDILSTCYAHQRSDFLRPSFDDQNTSYNQSITKAIPLLKNVVSNMINIGGNNANGGGRSGSITFDGSIDLNVGANTIDRQSIWLDTAGGIVGNIGRDIKNMSAALSMNGDVFLQVGGMGVSTDSRFATLNNGQIGAVLDIRVFNSGLRVTHIRIDDDGIIIASPGNMAFHAGGDLTITADSSIKIESEFVSIQNRGVLKEFGGSI